MPRGHQVLALPPPLPRRPRRLLERDCCGEARNAHGWGRGGWNGLSWTFRFECTGDDRLQGLSKAFLFHSLDSQGTQYSCPSLCCWTIKATCEVLYLVLWRSRERTSRSQPSKKVLCVSFSGKAGDAVHDKHFEDSPWGKRNEPVE